MNRLCEPGCCRFSGLQPQLAPLWRDYCTAHTPVEISAAMILPVRLPMEIGVWPVQCLFRCEGGRSLGFRRCNVAAQNSFQVALVEYLHAVPVALQDVLALQ